ncbi:MAG TPA: CHAT domain-containing protein [Candidatus Angelobacter sp.]
MQHRRLSIPVQSVTVAGFIALVLCVGGAAQTLPAPEEHAMVGTSPGIVVEAVEKDSAAEKAGLRAGDILLSWKCDSDQGNIESPFNLFSLETDQAPRAQVTLLGLRNEEKSAWQLGPDSWGIKARPNLTGDLLAIYLNGQDLAKDGKIIEAAGRWRTEGESVRTSPSIPSWLISWFYFHAAEVLANARKWQEADVAFQETIQRSSGSDPAIMTQLSHTWGVTYSRRNNWDAAEKYYLRAVENQRQATHADNLVVARVLNNIGLVAWLRGDLPKAERYYNEALIIRKQLAPGSLPVAGSLENLANVAEMRGNLAKAEQYYTETLEIKQKLLPGSIDVARTLNNLGILTADRDELVKADQYYYQALDIITGKISPDSPFFAVLNNGLGLVALDRGDADSAEAYFTNALTIERKLDPGSDGSAQNLNNLGLVAESRGDLAKAEQYYRESLAITQVLMPGSIEAAQSLANLGDVARMLRDFPHAEDYLQRALEIETKQAPDGDSAGDVLKSLGHLARDRGDLAGAEAYYRRALAIREGIGHGSREHAETLGALAGVVRRTQNVDGAADFYQQALNVLESQTAHLGGSENVRSGFRATHESYYKEYIDLLMSRNQPVLAFQIVERSRARTLLELLATSHLDVRKGVDPALLDQERNLKDLFRSKVSSRIQLLRSQHTREQLEVVDREIAACLRQHEDVDARIRAGSPGYAALTQPQPLDAHAVQRLLPDHTLLLEYSLGESHSYVFAITANSLNSYELPTSTEIESKAARLYQLLTERSRILPTENDRQRRTRLGKADAEFRSAANELSRMLLGPVAAGLQQRRLLIVSDGALQYIPFAALPTPGLSLRTPSYPLIVQHEIINLPSASVLAFLRHSTAANKEVMVFADPVFDNQDSRVKSDSARLDADPLKQNLSQDSRSLSVPSPQLARDLVRSVADMNPGLKGELRLPRLAFTRDEAKAILAVVRPGSGMEAMDFDASRKRAMSGELARYRVVHFATHALVDNIHPELSGLVLSLVDQRGNPVDGFLGLQDIYNLDLSADLVVLSACQTALGKQINGEGIIGLTRGFMYAGASGVMATLWNVNDFATAKLMAHFYKAMERDGMTPAQALRQAQLALWRSQPTAAPYYWAGFILQGGWQ